MFVISSTAAKPAGYQPAVDFDEEIEAGARRERLNRIIHAVCLAFAISQNALLSPRLGRSANKRVQARAALAVLINDLIPLDNKRTLAMVTWRTKMSTKALIYCQKQGRFRCGVDKKFRAKIDAMTKCLL